MSTKVQRSLIKLERFVFRPLFVFTTFMLVLFAIAQASGRLTLGFAHLFDDELNRILATQGVELTGLRGDWRGLNPVVRVDRAVFPAGVIDRLELELDVLESLFRSAPVARRMRIAGAEIHLERGAAGWQLRGMPPQDETIDVEGLINHSDEMSGVVTLHLHGQDGTLEQLVGHLTATNRGGVHTINASVLNPSSDGKGLHLALQRREAVPGLKEPEDQLAIDGQLALPSLLTGMANLNLIVHEGAWYAFDQQGAARLQIEVQNIDLPGDNDELTATASLIATQREDTWAVLADEISLHSGAEAFTLDPVRLSARVGADDELQLAEIFKPEPGPRLRLWVEELDLARLSRFAGQAVGDWEPVGRWVRALNVQGKASNIHAFADPDMGFGYSTSISAIGMNGYKGAPTLRNVQGVL